MCSNFNSHNMIIIFRLYFSTGHGIWPLHGAVEMFLRQAGERAMMINTLISLSVWGPGTGLSPWFLIMPGHVLSVFIPPFHPSLPPLLISISGTVKWCTEKSDRRGITRILPSATFLLKLEMKNQKYSENPLPTLRLLELFVRVIWKSKWVFFRGGSHYWWLRFDSKSISLFVYSINSNGLTWWENKKSLRVKELEDNIAWWPS